jgi:hypothetical protein
MRLVSSLASVVLLAGCPGAGTDLFGGDDTAVSDTGPVDHGIGTLTGMVNVQLYVEGSDGETSALSWEDYGGAFPFGSIFVAAYTLDETTGATTYLDTTVIPAPSPAGDAYSLAVDTDDASSVRVYAALDWWPDGVIGTSEPVGTWPDEVPLVEDTTVTGVDITIDAPYSPTGGDGGGGGNAVTLSGDLTIDRAYTGGNAKVMLYDSTGAGPSYVTSFTPTTTSTGAEAAYTLWVQADYGQGRLLGAWDSNINGLIEPTDTWGQYVVGGAAANPITVGAVDQTGLPVLIPFGVPPPLLPFVRLSGTLQYGDDFSTLPAGTVVYVAAARARLPGDLPVADLEQGYDWEAYSGADLVGTSIDYAMAAPAHATAYLWAYADTDADGVLNEVGEPVASYGPTGRIYTGSASQSGLDMLLQAVAE